MSIPIYYRNRGRRQIKTETTQQLERDIWIATHKQGVFACYEVTIGWYGDERVDYMTYDTKGVWRCYEIKCSKADFYSQAKKTFVGHFNYYVLTRDLYEQVKDDIPAHIGVYVGHYCVKRAKKQLLAADEQVLKNSMIRSLSREAEKLMKSDDPQFVRRMHRIIENERREKERYRDQLNALHNKIINKYGYRWDKEPVEQGEKE